MPKPHDIALVAQRKSSSWSRVALCRATGGGEAASRRTTLWPTWPACFCQACHCECSHRPLRQQIKNLNEKTRGVQLEMAQRGLVASPLSMSSMARLISRATPFKFSPMRCNRRSKAASNLGFVSATLNSLCWCEMILAIIEAASSRSQHSDARFVYERLPLHHVAAASANALY